MRVWARLEDGVAHETLRTAAPIETLFHPALTWVDVTDRTEGMEPDDVTAAKASSMPNEES